MEKLLDNLNNRIGVIEHLVSCWRGNLSAVHSRKRALDFPRESVVEPLEKLFGGLEDVNALDESKKRRLMSEKDGLKFSREECLDDIELRKEELDKQLKRVFGHIERLEVVQGEVQGIRMRMCTKLNEIEIQEQSLRSEREELCERERKVDATVGALNERINAVEKREKELDSFVEGKMGELLYKEEELRMMKAGFVKEVKLAEEKLRHCFVECLESAGNRLDGIKTVIEERFKAIEYWGNVARKSVEECLREADSVMGSMEKKLNEFEKMKREFNSFQEDKLQELLSKEQQLDVICKDFIEDAEFRNKQLIVREKSCHSLLERLDSAKENVEESRNWVQQRLKVIRLKEMDLNSVTEWIERKMDVLDSRAKELEEQEERVKVMEDDAILKELESKTWVQKKLKEICSKDMELNSVTDWIERKMDELDTRAKELEEQEERVKIMEDNLILKEKELESKETKLSCWEEELGVKQREFALEQELNDQRMEELEWKEKNLNSVKEFSRKCFKEHRAIKKRLLLEAGEVKREFELKEKKLMDHVKELEQKQQYLSDLLSTHLKTEADGSVDIKFVLKMDGKTLQMFLNDPTKDLGSMCDEIFKVLHLSADPAKLVLDAMVGFYPPHLRKGDVACEVRKTCIALLEQLIRMTPKIQYYIQEEAIEVANTWKSQIRRCSKNSLEVLGFLHLLAAYDLASYFDKDEICSFMVMVAEHRQTPALCGILGFKGFCVN